MRGRAMGVGATDVRGAPQPGRVIARPRVTRLLRGRFDHRVTVLVAPAGAGKTTALRLSIEANHLDPFGIDIFHPASQHDGDPAHLVAGLAGTVGCHSTGSVDATIEAIADTIWSAAPRDVVIIIDDAHLLGSSTAALATLADALPTNGHLLLSGRDAPSIPLARMRAHGQVLDITADDLGLDDDELAALIEVRLAASSRPAAEVANLPRLAAVADLRLRTGPGADSDFLWEEVLATVESPRREILQRACVLDLVDDDLVASLSDGTMTAAELVRGLPLVEAGENGTYRLHSILQAALRERTDRADLADAARLAAGVEIRRGNHRAAMERRVDAGDRDGALEVARRFALLPMMRRTFGDLLVVRSLVDQLDPGSLLGDMLRVESQFGELSTTTDVSRLGDDLLAVAGRARTAGDTELEAVVLYRAWEWISLERPVPADLVDRMVALAETVAFARQTVRFVLAEAAMFDGSAAEALAVLGSEPPRDFDRDVEMIATAGLLCSLGRPEQVGAGLTTADLAGMPDGAELYLGFALWNRGQLTPEQALPIALSMTAEVLTRRVVHPIVAILGVTTFMAVAAGDVATAERHVRRAREEARFGCAAHLLAFTAMAEAATTLTTIGEDAAATVLGEMLAAIPIGRWPIRAYLLGLPMLYLLRPECRDTLDRCDFGPALGTARDAGRALAELRSGGSIAGAAALPWHQDATLRAHVLPVHLCELAIAAEMAGVDAAADVIAKLPDRAATVRRVAEASVPAIAERARRRLDTEVPHPGITVRSRMLGPLQVIVDGRAVAHPDWDGRSRVRELFALLAIERRASRVRLASRCWPELDQARALRNLRVTLTYLNRALTAAWPGTGGAPIISTGADTLAIELELTRDVDEFEALMRRATDHDRAGAPAAALDLYRQALQLYEGDYLADLHAEWLVPDRTRLQVLATSAMLRVGELELAAGEPDRAVHWATRAAQQFPGNERAGRLLAACHISIGARPTAAEILRNLVDSLRADGIEPEVETTQALHRLTAR